MREEDKKKESANKEVNNIREERERERPLQNFSLEIPLLWPEEGDP